MRLSKVKILSSILIYCVNCCYFQCFKIENQQLPRCLRGQLTAYDVNPTPPRHSGSSFSQPFVPAQTSEMQVGTSYRREMGIQCMQNAENGV